MRSVLERLRNHPMVSLYRPDLPSQSWQVSRLFLAGLLDALRACVEGALALTDLAG